MEDAKHWRLGRLLLISLTLCGCALMAIAWWYYLRQGEALEASVSRELAAIAEAKSNQIANWRKERLGDGGILASAPVMMLARRVLSDRAVSAADRMALVDVLQRFVQEFQYAAASLVDRNGQPHVQLNAAQADTARFRELQDAANASGKVVLSDLYRHSFSGKPWMSLTVPIPAAGTIILEIDPSTFLYPYVRSWPTASRTGETLLVRREGEDMVYLNDLRYAGGTALLLRRSLRGLPLPDDSAYATGYAYRKWTDYRGVPTIGVIHEVPGSDWVLVAKIDASEVNEPLRRLGWEMALLVALIAGANAALAALIWRTRQFKIYRDREAWFRRIANETPAYLWTTVPGVQNSFINQQFARFLGTDRDQLDAGWPEYLHVEDKERVLDKFANCVASHCEYQDEFRIRRFDGAYRWVVAHGLPRYQSDGTFAGYAGALSDVTGRRQAEQKLRDANEALASELRERTRSEQEVQALTARLISAQEEERARLARELHDDLSQQIAAVSIANTNLKKQMPVEAVEAIAQSGRIQQKLVNLAQCVRRLSHQLHPAVLEHSGLTAALRNLCSEFTALTSHRIAIAVEGPCDEVPPAMALCVYRVTQEALQNSIKHAGVDEAEVRLTYHGGVLCLKVSDRGVGIDPEKAAGLGLVSMKERTRLVNGTVDVESRPGKGTIVTLKIPMPKPVL